MSKATKEKIRNSRMDQISMTKWSDHGIEKFIINEYQVRFVKGKVRMDYYPTSGKYFDIDTQHWGTCTVEEIPYFFETY